MIETSVMKELNIRSSWIVIILVIIELLLLFSVSINHPYLFLNSCGWFCWRISRTRASNVFNILLVVLHQPHPLGLQWYGQHLTKRHCFWLQICFTVGMWEQYGYEIAFKSFNYSDPIRSDYFWSSIRR